MIFLRHPTPDIAPGICYGRLDLEIAEVGHTQIAKAAQSTPVIRRIFASPARRCRKLAETLASRDNLELVFDERLWEMNMGEWEGKPWTSLDRTFTEEWLKDPVNRPTPGGESFSDVQTRVMDAIADIGFDDHTAIVCHAGPIRSVQMAWLGLTFSQAFAETPPYAEPIRVRKPSRPE